MPREDDLPVERGWGVFRQEPWHLAGVFKNFIEAHRTAMQLASDYQVRLGSHALGSDQFQVFEDSNQHPTAAERQWFAGTFSNGASFRILLRGELGAAELDQLIQSLSAERTKSRSSRPG
jgi:hypothetical protein